MFGKRQSGWLHARTAPAMLTAANYTAPGANWEAASARKMQQRQYFARSQVSKLERIVYKPI